MNKDCFARRFTAASGLALLALVSSPPLAGGELDVVDAEVFSEGGALAGIPEAGDFAGAAVAAGDFNGDGWDDLAIAVPAEDVGSISNAGKVVIKYGGEDGVTIFGQTFHQNIIGVPGVPEAEDFFASTLAAGDLNRDGFDDLFVGTSDEDIGSVTTAGAVTVFAGTPSGLDPVGALQDAIPTASAKFGDALLVLEPAVGSSELPLLAIGVPFSNISGVDSGSIQLWGGSQLDQLSMVAEIHQATPGVPGISEGGDSFGSSLAALRRGIATDYSLLVGAQREDIGSVSGAGAFWRLDLDWAPDGSGLQLVDAEGFSQGDGTIPGASEEGDQFGEALATGDWDNDGRDDMAIGAWLEDLPVGTNSGGVTVLYATGERQYLSGARGSLFGSVLLGADVDGDGVDDLSVGGALLREWNELPGTGGVRVFLGSPDGLSTTPSAQIFPPDRQFGGDFGTALAVGRFDAVQGPRLLVGDPLNTEFENEPVAGRAWLIQLRRDGIFCDALETGDLSRWN